MWKRRVIAIIDAPNTKGQRIDAAEEINIEWSEYLSLILNFRQD